MKPRIRSREWSGGKRRWELGKDHFDGCAGLDPLFWIGHPRVRVVQQEAGVKMGRFAVPAQLGDGPAEGASPFSQKVQSQLAVCRSIA